MRLQGEKSLQVKESTETWDPMHDDDGYDAMRDARVERGTWNYGPRGASRFDRRIKG